MDTKLHSEDIATSKKRTELAIQQCAKEAEISSMNTAETIKVESQTQRRFSFRNMSTEEKLIFYNTKILRLETALIRLKERRDLLLSCPSETAKNSETKVKVEVDLEADYDLLEDQIELLSNDRNVTLKEVKRQERETQKQVRLQKKEAKVKAMSPDRQLRYQARQEELAKRRLTTKDLSKEEKRALRDERQLSKIKLMTPERLTKYLERQTKRQEQKDALSKLSIDELKELKRNKRVLADKRRDDYNHLKENLIETLPSNLGQLIVDGNNLRGGGPRRHSRDVILKHIQETIEIATTLKNSNITVYFDHKPAKYQAIANIDVKFSGDQIADDSIVEEATELVKQKSVLVITNDRGLGIRLLALGALVMKNRQFNEINPNAPKNQYRGSKSQTESSTVNL